MTLKTLSLALLLTASLSAQTATTAGRFQVEHPTLHNLGFDWLISGDSNRNAQVAVQFRAAGESAWRSGLPLLRIGGEQIGRDRENLKYLVPHGFAGSILNLTPGTEYECRFTLTDPDGASGQTTQTVKVRTRHLEPSTQHLEPRTPRRYRAVPFESER